MLNKAQGVHLGGEWCCVVLLKMCNENNGFYELPE